MGKVKFTIREQQKPKHSIYASHVSTGTLSFEDAIKFACKGTDIEESAMRRDITYPSSQLRRARVKDRGRVCGTLMSDNQQFCVFIEHDI